MQRTIDPAYFKDGPWEELYNASVILPRTMESRADAKPIQRGKKQIQLAADCCRAKIDSIKFGGPEGREEYLGQNAAWIADLTFAAEMLESIIDAGRVESCPKCGRRVKRADAFEDEGEGAEAGRTFFYCSEHCRETH